MEDKRRQKKKIIKSTSTERARSAEELQENQQKKQEKKEKKETKEQTSETSSSIAKIVVLVAGKEAVEGPPPAVAEAVITASLDGDKSSTTTAKDATAAATKAAVGSDDSGAIVLDEWARGQRWGATDGCPSPILITLSSCSRTRTPLRGSRALTQGQ